ncbi:PINIT domain-containing protein [Roridomyces roridus]|uniref:PINIT domain-containing protein n=1 Tax=Roridomyces roridus TaxID=1738132 RepID=A0AAD7FCC3_9AGAR|nr:PINIT domain-containing protein [Roridomyces roridus]
MTAPASSTWAEMKAVSDGLPSLTVVGLKDIISGINTACRTSMSKSGRKQELIDRLRDTFAFWRTSDTGNNWRIAKTIIEQAQIPIARFAPSIPMPASAAYSVSAPPPVVRTAAQIPLPPSRSASGSATPHPPSTLTLATGYRFQPSPFFTVQQTVSQVLECHESYNSTDRRDVTLQFTLTPSQLTLLKASSPANGQTQLRLFCTTSKFYSPHGTHPYGSHAECPIEFPSTCEIHFNDSLIPTSLVKGMKKRPGTAPPPDLGAVAAPRERNTVRMVYVNTVSGGMPGEMKKFYLVAQIVEAKTVESLVDTLVRTRFMSEEEVLKSRAAPTSDGDDEILSSTLKLPLRCPLSFARITTPARSVKCNHAGCFDATSWYSVMQQTTTWLCPVCENALDWRELIVDGYFTQILKSTPSSVDDVLVEADGAWRTADGKYSSASGALAVQEYEYIDSDSD